MIEQTIDYILSKSTSGCADGWLADAEHYFCEHVAWTAASANRTNDPRCLLELKAIASSSVESLQNLRAIEEGIWKELAWSHYQASGHTAYREASVLRFVTVVRDDSSCTTGRMIIGGDHYSELVRRAENKSRRALPQLPFEIDLSELDSKILSPDQLLAVRRSNDWNEDELLIPQIIGIIKRIEECIFDEATFLASEVNQDALRFNLDALSRATGSLSFGRTDVAEWRSALLKVVHPSTKPWTQEPKVIFALAEEQVPKLLPLIENYRSMNAE